MRKIVMLLAVLIIAFLLLGAPYLMGMRAETAVLKTLQDQSYPHYRVTTKEYHRGWFHSDAVFIGTVERPSGTTKVNGQNVDVPADSISVEIKQHIVHGPILFSNGRLGLGIAHVTGELSLTGPLKDQIKKLMKDQNAPMPVLTNDTSIGFNESFDTTLSIPKVVLRDADGNGEFTWDGVSIESGLSGDRKVATSEWKIGGLVFAKDNNKSIVKISDIIINARMTDVPSFLNSEFHFSLPSVTVDIPNEKFSMEKFAVNTKTETKNKLFSWDFSISLDKLQFNSQHYNSTIMDFSLKNLDVTAMKELESEIRAANDAGNNESQRTQVGIAMLMTLPKLVNQGSQFVINQMKSITPDGEIVVTGNITVPAKKESMNPLSQFQESTATFQLSLPKVTAIQIMADFIDKDVKKPTNEEAKTPKETSAPSSKMSAALSGAVNQNETASDQPTDAPVTSAASKEKASQQVEAWLKDGYLTQDNQSVVTKITYSNGELQINGKKVQLGK